MFLEYNQTLWGLRQNLPLYCNSLLTRRKEKQQTNNFKPLFSTYPQQNGKRYFRPQKQNFSLNNGSPFKETAGLQLCLYCADGAVQHSRGRSPWAPAGLGHAQCAHTAPPASNVLYSALPSSFQNRTGGSILPRGFSMAMTALCWLLALTKHGHFGAAEQGRHMQQRGCCSVSCSLSCSRQRCPHSRQSCPVACAKKKAFQSKSLCNLSSRFPTCTSTQLELNVEATGEVCACAFCILRQTGTATGLFLDSSANLLSQPVSTTPQQAEAAAQEVPLTSATGERWVPWPQGTCSWGVQGVVRPPARPWNGTGGTWEQGKPGIPCDASPRNRGWGLCCQAGVSTPGRSCPSWMSEEN